VGPDGDLEPLRWRRAAPASTPCSGDELRPAAPPSCRSEDGGGDDLTGLAPPPNPSSLDPGARRRDPADSSTDPAGGDLCRPSLAPFLPVRRCSSSPHPFPLASASSSRLPLGGDSQATSRGAREATGGAGWGWGTGCCWSAHHCSALSPFLREGCLRMGEGKLLELVLPPHPHSRGNPAASPSQLPAAPPSLPCSRLRKRTPRRVSEAGPDGDLEPLRWRGATPASGPCGGDELRPATPPPCRREDGGGGGLTGLAPPRP
jgi:hypothetical protein